MTNKEKRIENYRKQRQVLLEEGYTEYVKTISIAKANIWALITAGPFAALAVVLYLLKWETLIISKGLIGAVFLILLFIISIPIHEGLHGLAWGSCSKKGFKSIHFGIMKESLTPYCHCMEPLRFGAYLCGGLMPFLVLGIGVFSVSFFIGSAALMLLSVLNILCAGGDTTIVLLLLPYRDAEILDHPTDCGFVAFRKEKGGKR